MNNPNAGALLRSTELFASLDEDTADQLAQQMITRSYSKGQQLVHQGDAGATLFVIVDGCVSVFVTSENGDRMTLATLGRTDVFGEIALLDEGPRSASAEAVERTTVLTLSRSAFVALLRDQPAVLDQLLRVMGALARRLSEQTADFVFLDLPGRVAKVVLRLAQDSGLAANGNPVEVAVTQARLAEMVGGSRQSVNQILQNFQQRGMLEVAGRRLVVTDAELLRRRAGIAS
ncbi:MAG TPA: Crp/Fnr family transcriptional regulator [Mycobacteriales bacterium]|nr:Crp/Fnr family transcriptional regulator [Mycobacteriales bacterium]